MSEIERLSRSRCFEGHQDVYEHDSEVLSCRMRFAAFSPQAASERELPVLYFLSGLTCTEQNFITKAGAQRFAAEHELLLVAPDTSPRGEGVPDDEAYDLGAGAGFYLNATVEPWARHYRMYDYVVHELPRVVDSLFSTNGKKSIMGHSMGGHGALVIALRNEGVYRSVSAFSPIASPMRAPWGVKAFTAYLGEDREAWRRYDSVELLSTAQEKLPLLIDQGADDPFREEQLKPELFEEACAALGHPLTLRIRPGYDHSYFFIATFIGDHFAHHAAALVDPSPSAS